MTARNVCSVIAVGVLACVLPTALPERVLAQETSVLPADGGMVTVVGCFLRGGEHDRFMLFNSTAGPQDTAPTATCEANGDGQGIDLKDTGRHDLGKSTLGRWIEVTGRLEPIEDADDAADARELHVRSFRMLPVAVLVPQAAEALSSGLVEPPAAAPQVEAAEETPVATTGTAPATEPVVLPATGSPLSFAGVAGLLLVAGGLCLRRLNGPPAPRRRRPFAG